MLDYALALTRDPGNVGREHVERLFTAGLSDSEIHRVAVVVAYFNLVNRIAEGLGVELEEQQTEGPPRSVITSRL